MPLNQQSENMEPRPSKLRPWIVMPSRRDALGAIRSGLDLIFALHQALHREAYWASESGAESAGMTASILMRLADVPARLLSHSHRQAIQNSLDWLTQAQDNGCWQNDDQKSDCLTTALAVIALRSHGRNVPPAALEFLAACRAGNGSFAASPDSHAQPDALRALALTATACRALECVNPLTERFFVNGLGPALPVAGSCNASRLFVCSEMLDWPAGQASMALLSKVTQLTMDVGSGTALAEALLLRSLLRLRISRSWCVAARLREMQAEDGSWRQSFSAGPSSAPSPMLASQAVVSATAVSGLAMAESQPGLYFGSDLPLPQRF
jgi:hypothetical protein